MDADGDDSGHFQQLLLQNLEREFLLHFRFRTYVLLARGLPLTADSGGRGTNIMHPGFCMQDRIPLTFHSSKLEGGVQVAIQGSVQEAAVKIPLRT